MPLDFSRQRPKRRRRVLLVEDHTNLRRLWADMLRLNGYEADVAADGREALEQLAASTYDAIVSDVHMPVLNGVELFDACRIQFPEVLERFIFITGAWYADSEEMCRATGRPCLLKFFAWEHLEAAMQAVFAAHDASGATPTDPAP